QRDTIVARRTPLPRTLAPTDPAVPASDALADLDLLIRAHYALIVLETVEPERAEELVRQAASDLNLQYYYWTRSKGVRRGNAAGDSYFEDTQEPDKALKYAQQD